MFYCPEEESHGLALNPFKALVIPRPIAWISTVSRSGRVNLAPFSYFNALATDPPIVMFATGGRAAKDSAINARDTGEFVVNIVPEHLFAEMVSTSDEVGPQVDEAEMAGVDLRPSRVVHPPSVAASPINLECSVIEQFDLPSDENGQPNKVTIGRVIGIHIDDAVINDGQVDVRLIRPLARLGYKEYAVVDRSTTLDSWLARLNQE